MAKRVQRRRGTTEQHESFVGAEAEVTFDTTLKTLRLHDGETPGGIIVPPAATTPSLDSDNTFEGNNDFTEPVAVAEPTQIGHAARKADINNHQQKTSGVHGAPEGKELLHEGDLSGNGGVLLSGLVERAVQANTVSAGSTLGVNLENNGSGFYIAGVQANIFESGPLGSDAQLEFWIEYNISTPTTSNHRIRVKNNTSSDVTFSYWAIFFPDSIF